MQALTTGQRELLTMLAEDSVRIWRSPAGYKMTRPVGQGMTLTEGTVLALVTAGYLRQVESYGRDRGLYEISDVGKLILRTEKASA